MVTFDTVFVKIFYVCQLIDEFVKSKNRALIYKFFLNFCMVRIFSNII